MGARQDPMPQVTQGKGLGEPNRLEPGGTQGPGRRSKDTQWVVGEDRRRLVISEPHIVESDPERVPGDSELTSACARAIYRMQAVGLPSSLSVV